MRRRIVAAIAVSVVVGGCAVAAEAPAPRPAHDVLERRPSGLERRPSGLERHANGLERHASGLERHASGPDGRANGLERPVVRTETPREPAREHVTVTAKAAARRVRAFRRPGAPRPFEVFHDPNEYGYRPVFLVKRARGDWLEVYLPIRPNGATGWVRARDVRLTENPFRIAVDIGRNRLTVQRGDRVLMRERVAVGTDRTPTPTGLFYTRMEVRTRDPGGAYGPYIQVLSAYSEVHFTFGGGNGEVGIHGTNAPSLLGKDVSNGCIRMRNGAITRLTRLVPVGTPVEIRP